MCAVVRAGVIAAVSAAHGVRAVAGRVAIWRVRPDDDLPRRVAALLEDLGPTFIKAGQILSCRPDLLPRSWCDALGRLQEDVAPVPARQVTATIEDAFGAPLSRLFAHFDCVPIAAGAIAQVHRAVLSDGRVVAVKVRRPDAVRHMEGDFAIMFALASFLSRVPALRALPIRELIEHVAAAVCGQLDLQAEADNHRRLRLLLADADHLRIPALVEPLCAASVLTMEFVDGLQHVVATPLPSPRRQALALTGLRALYRMIFREGLVHADMHPGNVFVRRDGGLVLLDMGLVARLSPDDRRAFTDFFFGLVNGHGAKCARILIGGASAFGPRYDAARFEHAIVELVDRYARLRSSEFEITRFVGELLDRQRRFDVRGSTAFITTVLAMVVYDGICKQLYPDCDFQAEARGFLILNRYATAEAARAASG